MQIRPETPDQLAEALASAASSKQSINLRGAGTKHSMGGPVTEADVTITTTGLRRVLQYEPRDLTISVEAGITFAELSKLLAANRQMVPLDPPFEEHATVGGAIASNSCGPRRRLYGSARDLVIGMRFATLEGKLIDTGGMVVKNVAGLDMGKLMIGSFGTLAAIASVNFKLLPIPAATRTFVMQFDTVAAALTARDSILKSVLQPTAIDLLNSQAGAHLNRKKHLLLVQAGGSARMLGRYEAELGGAEQFGGEEEDSLWRRVRNFTPHYLKSHSEGAVVRASCTLDQVQRVVEMMDVPVVARAGSGVCYGYFWECDRAVRFTAQALEQGIQSAIEFAPSSRRSSLELWPSPGSGFEVMKKIKNMFDPGNFLNRGRLYGRI